MKRLYYDGQCPFCCRLAQMGRRLFSKAAIEWIPVDYTDQAALPIPVEAVIYQEDEQYWTKSEAIRQLLWRNGYRTLAWLLGLCPRPWRDRLYDYVADRRYCGNKGKCQAAN
ncbi:MAG: DUF393 domain-containing protein [Bacteroidia bacterium]|nr:DUF393 domain-containing protein [Bacteroidia bacterium]MCX7652179.1 DUF393 domain-containing protein [Bacteroidia bacterium]MDW8416441.1 DUF393 domain-containing protein [Bacteroidia bacterium]